MKYCPNCGKELFDEAVMCPGCKTSFVKKFKLTVFHREQALPLVNPAINSEIDGAPPIPVKKGDSIVYELDEGRHFVRLTGHWQKSQFDINLNCDLIIMAEWNAATGGIDYRITQGQIQGSLPVNFQVDEPVVPTETDQSPQQDVVPENVLTENEQTSEPIVEQPIKEQPTAEPEPSGETAVGEYYQPPKNDENTESITKKRPDIVTVPPKHDDNKVTIALVVVAVILAITITLLYIGISQNVHSTESETTSSQSYDNSQSEESTNTASATEDTTQSTEESTESTTSYESSVDDRVTLYDYMHAAEDLSSGISELTSYNTSMYVDNFVPSKDGKGLDATLYFDNKDVGVVYVLTEVIDHEEYVKRVTVMTSFSEIKDSFGKKENVILMTSIVSMSPIMPLLNDCESFSLDDIQAMIRNCVKKNEYMLEGDSNNYSYYYSQPTSYYEAFLGCEYNG